MAKLVDEVKIFVKAGDGGSGCASFRREKYVPRGGPDGGDGGYGGNIYLQSTPLANSLVHLTKKQHYYAERGGNGRKKCLQGKKGKDLVLQVPLGTVLIEDVGDNILHDFRKEERLLIAEGGKGGKGNARFATSTHQAPRRAEKGKGGEERWIRLVLKLLADIAIIGLPNAGKSTLLSALTSANSKIAAYPFTTLNPVLGMLELEDYRSFVVADMPPLIKGSHKGEGLGNRFLRHIERCKLLLHIIDSSTGGAGQLSARLEEVDSELAEANQALSKIPQIVVLNKIDLLGDRKRCKSLASPFEEKGLEYCFISALQRQGIDELLNLIDKELDEQKLEQSKGEEKLQLERH